MITGSGTCKWYINANAAEVQDFQDRLPENFPPIEWLILIVILTSSSLRISRKILKETAHEITLLSPHEFIVRNLLSLTLASLWLLLVFNQAVLFHKSTFFYGRPSGPSSQSPARTLMSTVCNEHGHNCEAQPHSKLEVSVTEGCD